MIKSKSAVTKGAVAIIDWNVSGHHATYLREYILSFVERSTPVIILSPEKPSLDKFGEICVWREIPTILWMKKLKHLGTPFARWLFARRIAAAMRDAEAELEVKCVHALFGCFYENQAKLAVRVITKINLPASGLYLHAGIFHSGAYLRKNRTTHKVLTLFKHPQLRVIYMLDEGTINKVAEFSEKQTALLPDITDYSTDNADPLPANLGLIPKKRPVIGLLGHLRPSKGVSEFVAFARSVPDLDVTFLLAGYCSWDEFPPEEKESIQQVLANDSRFIFYPHRIPKETSYNALIQSCDILWAVYRDCPHSSNTLAKAAFFQKPVVVAEGHLMARITRRFGLGIIVPTDAPEKFKKLLLQLVNNTPEWLKNNPPNWSAFRNENSNENFRKKIYEKIFNLKV